MDSVLKHKQKKEEEEGFDALKASYLEKGLIASGDARSIGLRAIGQTHSISEKHHAGKVQKQEANFKAAAHANHGKSLRLMLGAVIPVKLAKPKRSHLPNQLKDKGGPDSSKGGSGSKKA